MNYLLLCNGYPFLWVSSSRQVEYLDSFKSLDACVDFHASCPLDVFDLLTGKKSLQELVVF